MGLQIHSRTRRFRRPLTGDDSMLLDPLPALPTGSVASSDEIKFSSGLSSGLVSNSEVAGGIHSTIGSWKRTRRIGWNSLLGDLLATCRRDRRGSGLLRNMLREPIPNVYGVVAAKGDEGPEDRVDMEDTEDDETLFCGEGLSA